MTAIQKQTQLGSTGIKNIIQKDNKFNRVSSIFEYIWNGFDANASKVKVYYNIQSEIIKELKIIDNGIGIPFDNLKDKFDPIYNSEKNNIITTNKHTTLPHGRKGIGRLSFFLFANKAIWETTYFDSKKRKKFTYSIEIDASKLNNYKIIENLQETNNEIGTSVCFKGFEHKSILGKKNSDEYLSEFIVELKKEFCSFLELNRDNGFHIIFNDNLLTYEDFILDKTEFKEELNGEIFEFNFIQWNVNLKNENSRYYLLNSKNIEIANSTTGLNKQSDNFFNSTYITSNYFNKFEYDQEQGDNLSLISENVNSNTFKDFLEILKKFLLEKRRVFVTEKDSYKFIKKLNEKYFFPPFQKENIWEAYRHNELEETIRQLYIVLPKLFNTLNEQTKIIVRLINELLDGDKKNDLLEVFNKTLDLSSEDLKKFRKQLEVTSLDRIIESIEFIKDKIITIEKLERLILDDEKTTYEKEVQEIVENNYWIFGEEYRLVAKEEDRFEKALRNHLELLGEEVVTNIEHENKNKEVDLFISRIRKKGDIIENIIVELKRPRIKLGKKEFDQILEYAKIIKEISHFNGKNRHFKYYLIGNKLKDDYIEGFIDQLKHNNKNGLAFISEKNKIEIYVKTWSELLTEIKLNLNWIEEKLEIDKEKLINSDSHFNTLVEIKNKV